MNPKEYFLTIGIRQVFITCSNNLKMFKAHIERECPQASKGQVYYILNKAKEIISQNMTRTDVDEEIYKILKLEEK